MALIAIGIWVIILPHLGVPGAWHTVITSLTGIFIIGMGLYWRAAALARGMRRSSHHPFVENIGDGDTQHGQHEQNHKHTQVN